MPDEPGDLQRLSLKRADGSRVIVLWRPVAVWVTGDQTPDGLIESVDALSLDEALAALPTDVEREALRAGAALFAAAVGR